MPALPVCLLGPVWEQFAVLLPAHPELAPTHTLGCHRRRVLDRVVFEHIVAALVHGSGYERIATPGCSDRTIRRRVRAWSEAGLTGHLHALALAQYDRMIGLELDVLVVDGCVTKAPCGDGRAGRSPVDRGEQGLKWSTVTDATGTRCMGFPLGRIAMMGRCSARPSTGWVRSVPSRRRRRSTSTVGMTAHLPALCSMPRASTARSLGRASRPRCKWVMRQVIRTKRPSLPYWRPRLPGCGAGTPGIAPKLPRFALRPALITLGRDPGRVAGRMRR